MKDQKILGIWFSAIRPKTLTAALIPILVGSSLAYSTHQYFRPAISFFALLSVLFIQIGTNLINDAFDFKKGADTAERIGPKRVTQSGAIEAKKVAFGGLLCFLIAIIFALPLVYLGGWPIFWIGFFSLIAGYAYTGGPYPLAYLGLGDLFVLIFFGWVAVTGIYYLHTNEVSISSFVAGSQIGLLATVLIAINNLRDHRTDTKAHKKTLAVRFGPRFVCGEIYACCLLPFVLGLFWLQKGMKWASLLPFIIFPLAIILIKKIRRTAPSREYNRFLAQGALVHLGFGIFLSLGFLM